MTRKTHPKTYCPFCQSQTTIKAGKRITKFQARQLFRCKTCARRFTPAKTKHKTYPIRTILDAISLYNLGYSLTEAAQRASRRHRLPIKPRTLASWIATYKPLCRYSRLRPALKRSYNPQQLILRHRLNHQQVYLFLLHRGKLDALLSDPSHHAFQDLATYLLSIPSQTDDSLFLQGPRSSTFDLELSVPPTRKTNYATNLADLALQAARTNRHRHSTLQNFMLANDSVTVAAEIPVYLTPHDVAVLRRQGFRLPFELEQPLTGHIDILQIRNGLIHILDYKPQAAKETHAATQLTLYALGLARSTGLAVKNFKCAWFDMVSRPITPFPTRRPRSRALYRRLSVNRVDGFWANQAARSCGRKGGPLCCAERQDKACFEAAPASGRTGRSGTPFD